MPFVYVLHFEQALGHQQHYAGCCNELEERLAAHRKGRGAVLTARLKRAGLGFVVGAQWEFATFLEARRAERRVKKAGSARRCGVCNPEQVAE